MLILSLSLAALLPLLILAQDGSLDGPASSADSAGYSCDPSECRLPKCNCASAKPPGGLNPVSTLRSPCWRAMLLRWWLFILSCSLLNACGSVDGCPSIHRLYGRRCYPIVHPGRRQPIPCPTQKPQWMQTLNDLLHFPLLHQLHPRHGLVRRWQ